MNNFRRRFSLIRLVLIIAVMALAVRMWPPQASKPPIQNPIDPPPAVAPIEDDVEDMQDRGKNDPSTISGKVVFIPDGDSLDLKENGTTHRVRLWGIDAPEGNTRQPFSRESRDFARRQAQDKTVRLVVHETDRFGRLVGEVILPDGNNLNRELVDHGWAWHFDRHAPHEKKLADAQEHARSKRLGLWKDERPIPPWEWRRQHPARRD